MSNMSRMNTPFSGISRMPFMHQHDPTMSASFSQPSLFSGIGATNHTYPPANPATAPPAFSNNPMNEYLDQHLQQNIASSQMTSHAIQDQTGKAYQHTIPDHAKSLGSLTVADLVQILQPIQSSVEEIKTTLTQQMGALQTKVQVLENELKKEVTKNETLTSAVVSMQKCLNQIDVEKRVTNLMISGLPEEEMITAENTNLADDKEKLKTLLHNIGINDMDAEIDTFEYTRIGVANERKRRLLKVNVGSKDTRDKICVETKKIKLLPAPWKSIYINKDVHPVYLKENQRVRKKMQDLKKVPGFEHESGRVKLENGLLKVDGAIVDQNLFHI